MAAVLAGLDTREYAPIAVHYAAQPPIQGRPGDRKLAETGRRIYEEGLPDRGVPACAGCHQPDAGGNARFPRLAGQHQAYTRKQLADYARGRRATDRQMVLIAQALSAEEIGALAEYVAGL